MADATAPDTATDAAPAKPATRAKATPLAVGDKNVTHPDFPGHAFTVHELVEGYALIIRPDENNEGQNVGHYVDARKVVKAK